MERELTTDKVVALTYQAADKGAKIVLFPEAFIPLCKHRKLKPTASERLIWGEGDGSTLTVLDTPYGKLGGLICWENYMPLARMTMYSNEVSNNSFRKNTFEMEGLCEKGNNHRNRRYDRDEKE